MGHDDWRPPLLPAHLMQRGGSPDAVGKELLGIIKAYVENQPRSLQVKIGPSEIGQACARRIGYKLLNAPDFNPQQIVPWKAFIGTCVHAELANIFDRNNLAYSAKVSPGDERWLVEHKVTVGQLGPEEIDGHTDLYDRVTCGVIDWKIVGPSPLKGYKASGPGPQYRSQGHLYGRGWHRGYGLPVDYVMIVFLPRNGELHDTHIWHEPYDEQVAIEALNRAGAIKSVVGALGVEALTKLPSTDNYCYRCPYHKEGSTDPRYGCPGHPKPAPSPAITLKGKPA